MLYRASMHGIHAMCYYRMLSVTVSHDQVCLIINSTFSLVSQSTYSLMAHL